MNEELNRNLGEQPISKILTSLELKPHDLVAASENHLTHKMVSRACKGRRLTPRSKSKVIKALEKVTGKNYSQSDLFNY